MSFTKFGQSYIFNLDYNFFPNPLIDPKYFPSRNLKEVLKQKYIYFLKQRRGKQWKIFDWNSKQAGIFSCKINFDNLCIFRSFCFSLWVFKHFWSSKITFEFQVDKLGWLFFYGEKYTQDILIPTTTNFLSYLI